MSSQSDERANTRSREQRLGLVKRPRFEEYRKKYSKHFKLERRDGILQVQMHSDGGPVVFNLAVHNDWPQLWMDIGNDPDNEVLIFSGTGDKWIGGFDRNMAEQPISQMPADAFYDHIYWDATKLLEAFVFNVDIPTIACINGPGFHTEFALLCDITLCADHAVLFDPHFADLGAVPGDGQGLTFQELMGLKRAAYYLYTSDKIDAKTAKEIGLVNEVLPLDRLLPRAWEIAEIIMKKPRTVRRLTSAVLRRPWKRLIVQDLGFHLGHELLGLRLDSRM
ncbi:MAG TPA: enoyl-CoA hydratase/isomerase family protein [Candidatus Binataceae bacterium]|nr:enoyl-CoA hydratase/isomerase family protein [Candidatus Binataceae bacterium]